MTCHLQMTHCTSFNIYTKKLFTDLFFEDQGLLEKWALGFFFKKIIFQPIYFFT